MVEAAKRVLSKEDLAKVKEVHDLMWKATRACVESGCSAAGFAVGRITATVESGRLDTETARTIAAKFTACRGMFAETVAITPETINEETGVSTPEVSVTADMCHLPTPTQHLEV